MKFVVLLGALTAAVAAPNIAFADITEACRTDIERAEPERAEQTVAPGAQPRVTPQREAAQNTRPEPRRRGGKRIPDAELIGPRLPL